MTGSRREAKGAWERPVRDMNGEYSAQRATTLQHTTLFGFLIMDSQERRGGEAQSITFHTNA